jgi:hypothetical protein
MERGMVHVMGKGNGGMEGKWWDGRENDVMEGGMVGWRLNGEMGRE